MAVQTKKKAEQREGEWRQTIKLINEENSRGICTAISLVILFVFQITLLCATIGLAVNSQIQIVNNENKDHQTNYISNARFDLLSTQMKQLQSDLQTTTNKLRDDMEHIQTTFTDQLNITAMTQMNSLQLAVDNLNDFITNKVVNLLLLLGHLNTTITDQVNSLHSSLNFLNSTSIDQANRLQLSLNTLNITKTNQINDLQTSLNILNNTTTHQMNDFRLSLHTFNSTTIDQVNSLQSSLNTLNTTTIDQVTSLQSLVSGHQISLNTHIIQINQTNILQDNAITTLSNTLEQSLGITFWNPAHSCKEIPHERPSGYYWVQNQNSITSLSVQVYCDMDRTSCSCTNTAGWMRVANLDMKDPTQNCPVGFRLVTRTTEPRRLCGRSGSTAGCVSVTFPTYGVDYSHVCGRIVGYQFASPDGIRSEPIDSVYVDGISLTHGQSPRQHIWTFIGLSSDEAIHCPCSGSTAPSFIGQDYFCDSAASTFEGIVWYSDPLWDGQYCRSTNACCQTNNPPWFCRQLPQVTTDDIELRLCGDESTINNEDTPFELVEIFIR